MNPHLKTILKSCKYCGRVHSEDFVCPKKPKIINKKTEQNTLRSTYKWVRLREKIRKRDGYFCQICLQNGKYNCRELEVHHAVKICENPRLAFEPKNLITLCREHHRQADSGEIPLGLIQKIINEREKYYVHNKQKLFG